MDPTPPTVRPLTVRQLARARPVLPLARPAVPTLRPYRPPAPPGVGKLLVVLGFFALLMATLFGTAVHGLVGTRHDYDFRPIEVIHSEVLKEGLVVGLLDAGIVVLAAVVAGRAGRLPALGHPAYAWGLAVPGFGLLFGVNMAYHAVLRAALDVHPPEGEVNVDLTLADGWWAIGLVCVQPAVVEELFFRFVLLGHLRPHLGVHGAVLLSSVVFGMAHLGGIASWPVLILLGVGLGYARVASGGLALPMLLHFLHNFAVLCVEYEK